MLGTVRVLTVSPSSGRPAVPVALPNSMQVVRMRDSVRLFDSAVFDSSQYWS